LSVTEVEVDEVGTSLKWVTANVERSSQRELHIPLAIDDVESVMLARFIPLLFEQVFV
jgi:hypothetical protein